jgi:hypothetical protein
MLISEEPLIIPHLLKLDLKVSCLQSGIYSLYRRRDPALLRQYEIQNFSLRPIQRLLGKKYDQKRQTPMVHRAQCTSPQHHSTFSGSVLVVETDS